MSPARSAISRTSAACLLTAGLLLRSAPLRAGDWPTWRGNPARTGVCGEKLPDELHPYWVQQRRPQRTAWKDEAVMRFDRSYLPVAGGGLLFVASTVSDSLSACDLETGREKWRFYTGGPVRVAPAAWRQKVYLASDDGFLYCLAAADGKLKWRFRPGPRDRRLIGNERLISTWPVRGGPVVADGVVYLAAGVWPFMGTFVYALDAETGRIVWVNDSASFTFRRMPHPGSASFNGLSAQGHLAVAGDKLIVPGSASTPAVFDRRTGEFLHYGDGATGPRVAAAGRLALAGGRIFEINTGHSVRLKDAGRFGRTVLAEKAWYTSSGIYDPASVRINEVTIQVPETTDPNGPTYPKQVFEGTIGRLDGRRRLKLGTPWLLAGSRLVTTGKITRSKLPKGHTSVQVLDVSDGGGEPKVLWQRNVEGTVCDALAADGKLLVVTLEGDIHCFGPKRLEPRTHRFAGVGAPSRPKWRDRAEAVRKATGAFRGYGLVLGLKDGGLVEELVLNTRLHVVAVDTDPGRVNALRRRLDGIGVYGSRAAAIVSDPALLTFAPYLASLIVSEDPARAGWERRVELVGKLFHPLRPYGGAACLELASEQHEQFTRWVEEAKLVGAEVKHVGGLTVLRRPGALSGSADWLGQNADAANTRCSRDRLVFAPLGVLWFGNALSNRLILPRHGEGPVEQVVGGRLIIEGGDSLSAADVYTGRLLWTREFPDVGKYYNVTKHSRGAHAIGSNFHAVADAVYVAAGTSCHVLDPATGRTRGRFRLPDGSTWQYISVYEDLLVAAQHPIVDNPQAPRRYSSPTSSKALVVMDRRTGRVLWSRTAAESFRHYGVAAGRGKLFCIDRTAPETLRKLARRGLKHSDTPRVLALDARTGKLLWQSTEAVGGALSYSQEHDVVLSAGALRGSDGELIWFNPIDEDEEIDPAAGPATRTGAGATEAHLWWGKWGPMLHGRTILTQQQRAFDLLTGRQKTYRDARGRERQWRYPRSHGCGPMAASEHLITFRSGCAGFFDLKNNGGTGNLGGFRAGCTANLIVANGVLNAPDYTRTCGCAYQNRSSLALIHMPDVEYWTFGAAPATGRVGFNFGAPGDRRSADGTLWRETPNAILPKYGGRTLVATVPEKPRRFYHHSSRMNAADPWKWIGASGLVGIRSAKLPLDDVDPNRELTVRLYFCEPGPAKPAGRVFSVSLDGRQVLEDLDVAAEAGGPFRTLVKQFPGVRPRRRDAIELTFTARAGEPLICGAELIQTE